MSQREKNINVNKINASDEETHLYKVRIELGQRRVFSEIITVLESACTNARAALPYVPIEYNLYSASGRRLHKTTLPLSLPLFLFLFLLLQTEYTVNRYRLYTHSRIHCNPTRRRSQPNWWWAAVSQWNS